jgi:hypothetical protein
MGECGAEPPRSLINATSEAIENEHGKMGLFGRLAASLALAAVMSFSAVSAAAAEKITIWSHWADEQNKKDFVMEAVKRFKDKNPGFDVEVVWYQKPQLITALTTSFQAGSGARHLLPGTGDHRRLSRRSSTTASCMTLASRSIR